MLLSTKYQFSFLATPKCASTSIESALERALSENSTIRITGSPLLKHLSAKKFHEYFMPFYNKVNQSQNNNIKAFCLIRDPLDWINSWYRYRLRDKLKNANDLKYTGNISYNKFIEDYISDGIRPPYAKFSTQFEFMMLTPTSLGLDYIFPMDNLDKVSSFISEKIGEEIDIPKYNVSPTQKNILDKNLEDRLRAFLRKDIIIYNFVKERGRYDKKLHADELSNLLKNI